MDSVLLLGGFVGCVMLVVGLARIVPELAIDSPLELLLSFFTWRWGGSFYELIHAHIREGWPETKVVGFLYYGGLTCIGITVLISWIKHYFA